MSDHLLTSLKRLRCWLIGHRWRAVTPGGLFAECARCERPRFFADDEENRRWEELTKDAPWKSKRRMSRHGN